MSEADFLLLGAPCLSKLSAPSFGYKAYTVNEA